MDSTNPDLSRFAARGGKLVILENMADYAQSPYAGIRYFENVQRKLGKEKTAEFARLYTAPGVDHVGSGAPANVDMLAVLVDWVENGKAPGDLEVTEQKVEAPAFEATRALPLVPMAGMAALQIGRNQSRSKFCLRAVKKLNRSAS
jgi:feruloyl esterase